MSDGHPIMLPMSSSEAMTALEAALTGSPVTGLSLPDHGESQTLQGSFHVVDIDLDEQCLALFVSYRQRSGAHRIRGVVQVRIDNVGPRQCGARLDPHLSVTTFDGSDETVREELLNALGCHLSVMARTAPQPMSPTNQAPSPRVTASAVILGLAAATAMGAAIVCRRLRHQGLCSRRRRRTT